MSANLNLQPIKNLIDTINMGLTSNQKEIRISLQNARGIERALSHLLIHIVELQDKIITTQDNNSAGTLNIELQGEKF